MTEAEFLYRLEPVRLEMLEEPTPAEAEVLQRHFAYLQELCERHTLLVCGRTQTTGEDSFGIVVFRAANEAAAREIMENDPGVREGIMRAKLYPFAVALSAAPWPESV